MDSRKRPRENLPVDDNFKTPEKRFSVVCLNKDFMQWNVEDTCMYLRREGLGAVEERFREQQITGVGLRYLTEPQLEKMGIR